MKIQSRNICIRIQDAPRFTTLKPDNGIERLSWLAAFLAAESPAAGTAGTSGGAEYTCAGAADTHTAGAASNLGTAQPFVAALIDGQGSLPGQTTLDSAG